jgi:hypothetical protein
MKERACTPAEAKRHLLKGEAFLSSLDYVGAFLVAESLNWNVFSADKDARVAFRDSIEQLIIQGSPPWSVSIPVGREYVRQTLDEDAWQCFVVGGLTDVAPETVAWWDRLALRVRAATNDRLLRSGREAERKSFERETSLLLATGLRPQWIALDDNHAGYDIKSWRSEESSGAGFNPVYIEVKGSASGAEFHLTRREWQVAVERAAHWELQVWVNAISDPLIFRHPDIAPHIPMDSQGGRWESAIIQMKMVACLEEPSTP